jgi:hypothetical protein
MKAEYDFSKGRRGQAVPTKGTLPVRFASLTDLLTQSAGHFCRFRRIKADLQAANAAAQQESPYRMRYKLFNNRSLT